MANKKKKSNVKITSVKSNSDVLKKAVKTVVVNKNKSQQSKKKSIGNKVVYKNGKYSKQPVTKKKSAVVPVENNKVLNQEELNTVQTSGESLVQKKERNRKKYENQQRKYREYKNTRTKKNPVDLEKKVEETTLNPEEQKPENIVEKQEVTEKEETLVKKSKDKQKQTEKKEKEQERKEKRKTNQKTSNLTQTLNTIKELSVNKINDVREKVDDDTIPLGKTFDEKSKRSKRLINESIVYATILTIINIICIIVFDYFNFLRLFDVKALNVALTIIISLVFNFFVAFMVDYFVTNVWLVKKRKNEDGVQNGDSGSNKRKHQIK